MYHLLPSSCLREGFLERMLSGFGFLLGTGDFPRAVGDVAPVLESLRSGTSEPARRLGFLCVISDLSTFRRPEVIADPLFNCSKTDDISPVDTAFGGAAPPAGGGGGGGGPPAPAVGGGGGGGGGGNVEPVGEPD